MAAKNAPKPIPHIRAIFEDGTASKWINPQKPRLVADWQDAHPDQPEPETAKQNMEFIWLALGKPGEFDPWMDSVETLDTGEFEPGKANA